jgi:hypothetical protein
VESGSVNNQVHKLGRSVRFVIRERWWGELDAWERAWFLETLECIAGVLKRICRQLIMICILSPQVMGFILQRLFPISLSPLAGI